MRYKPIIDVVDREMEESLMEGVDEIDTIIAELEISKGKGNLILCVVNSPAYRDRIIQTLSRRFLSEVIFVENGEQIIRTLKSRDFYGADILIWVMPEEPTEDLLNTLNNFRELFYEAKIPNLVFYNQAFSESVLRKAPDFWRYRGSYYELKEAERGMAFEAIETLATPFSYQDKEDLLRRKRINEYLGRVLKLHEELGIKEGVASDYENIGNIYLTRGELAKALEYYEKALKLDEKLGRKGGIAEDYLSTGNVFRTKGELDKALRYYKKALKIFKDMGIRIETAGTLMNIGDIFVLKGDKGRGLDFYLEAKGLAKASPVFETVSKRVKRLEGEQKA